MLKSKLVLKLLPFYFLMALLVAGPLIWNDLQKTHIVKQNAAYISQAAPLAPAPLSGHPVALAAPRIGLSLNVLDGRYDAASHDWTLDWQDAFYATPTAEPNNQGGMTLIYGHETAKIFSPLYRLVQGDKFLITTSNHLQFEYYMVGIRNVSPNDDSILHATPTDPELTLLTCSGTFFQTRRLMTFKLLAVHQL